MDYNPLKQLIKQTLFLLMASFQERCSVETYIFFHLANTYMHIYIWFKHLFSLVFYIVQDNIYVTYIAVVK